MTTHSATVSYTGTGPNPLLRGLSAVAGFFADLQRASEAAANYQRLSHMSDAALAQRGLTRESLPKVAYEMAFAR